MSQKRANVECFETTIMCDGGKEVDLECGSVINLLTREGSNYLSQMWRNCKMALLGFYQIKLCIKKAKA